MGSQGKFSSLFSVSFVFSPQSNSGKCQFPPYFPLLIFHPPCFHSNQTYPKIFTQMEIHNSQYMWLKFADQPILTSGALLTSLADPSYWLSLRETTQYSELAREEQPISFGQSFPLLMLKASQSFIPKKKKKKTQHLKGPN